MLQRTRTIAFALALPLLATGISIAFGSKSASGTVSGGNTIDYVYFTAPQGSIIDYSFSGSGTGTNELEVKIQQKGFGGTWWAIDSEVLQMPSDADSGSVTVLNWLSSTNEELRVRLSRKILTSAVNWSIDCDW